MRGTGERSTEGLKKSLYGLRSNRLGQVVVETRVERAAPVLFLAPAGHRNENDAPSPRRCPNVPSQLIAVDIRQTDIQQKRVRMERFGELKRPTSTICRLHMVTR